VIAIGVGISSVVAAHFIFGMETIRKVGDGRREAVKNM
jgi:hypothetical protein